MNKVLLERIEDNFDLLIKTWGGSVSRTRQTSNNLEPEVPTVEQILANFGGKQKGVVLEVEEKNGR